MVFVSKFSRLVLLVVAFSLSLSAQSTFSPNVRVFDPSSTDSQTGAEPGLALDANNAVFVDVPNGRVRLWRSLDQGGSWAFLGRVDADLIGAGGDSDAQFDALNRLYVADLVLGLGLTSTITRYTNPETITSVTQRDFRTLTFPAQDRMWLATFGNNTVYLAFHDIAAEQVFVMASFNGAATFLAPVPAITDPVLAAQTIPNTNDGRIVTDASTAAVYVMFAASVPQDNLQNPPFGPLRRLILARSFDNGLTWEDFIAFDGTPGTSVGNIFPGFAIDRSGNLYAVFAANLDSNMQQTSTLNIFYIRSTDQGATWSRPVQVNSDSGTHVFPWIVAGCQGAADIVWYGTNVSGNPNTLPSDAPWNIFFAQTLNGLSSPPAFLQAKVSDHVIHVGQISTGGTFGSSDRRLLDFFEVESDTLGLANLVWADTGTVPFTGQGSGDTQLFYARQTSGTGILNCPAPLPGPDITGGGFILDAGGNHLNFGLNFFSASLSGHLTYIDHSGAGFTFKASQIASISKTGNQATITGNGTIGGAAQTSFSVTVIDNGQSGTSDFFSISLGTGYQRSGTLAGGNIQVR